MARRQYYRPQPLIPKQAQPLIEQAASAAGESPYAYIANAVIMQLDLPQQPDGPVPTQLTGRTAAPACVICGNPLPEGKLRYCSDACRRKGRSLTTQACKQRKLADKSDE